MPKQKRARGRPKKNWMEGIRKTMNERNLNEGQWEDRKQWSLGVGQRRKTFWNIYIYIYILLTFAELSTVPYLGEQLSVLKRIYIYPILEISSNFEDHLKALNSLRWKHHFLSKSRKIAAASYFRRPESSKSKTSYIQRDSKIWTQFRTSIFPELYMVCEWST